MIDRSIFHSVLAAAIGLCAVVGLASPAAAQFAATRAIDRAVNLNVSLALERIQVRLQYDQPSTAATLAVLDTAGRRLMVAHQAGEFEVWTLGDGQLAARGGQTERIVTAGAFGADNALVLVRGQNRISVVKAGANHETSLGDTAETPITLLAAHPTQPRMIVMHADGALEVLDYAAARVLHLIHTKIAGPLTLTVDRSGNYAALTGSDGKLTVWDLSTGLMVTTVDLHLEPQAAPAIASSFGVSADRLTVVTGNGHVLQVKGNDVAAREMCKAACVLSAAGIAAAGDEIIAVTATGEQINWKRGDRQGAEPKALNLGAPLTAKPGLAVSMIALPLANGTVQLQRTGGGEATPLTLATTPEGWVAMDTTGRFDGPSSAQDQLKWVGDKLAVPLTSFVTTYYEPGLLRKWAAGANIKSYLTSPPPIGSGVAVPPLAAVNATITVGKGGRKNLRIAIEAEDRGGGLGQVYLYHQGVLVSDRRLISDQKETVDKKVKRRLEYEVPAVSGLNSFGVTAENAEGVLSPLLEQNVGVDQKPAKPTLHLLAVGLNKYDVTRLNLDYARRDAEQLTQVMKTQSSKVFDAVNVMTLYDEKVDRESLLKAFAELKASNAEDTIVVYFAGHGAVLDNEFYFLTHGVKYPFKAGDAKINGLSITELSDLIADLEARKVILLLDTCKSGDALGDIDKAERDQRVLGIFGGRLGIHLLAGTDKGQLASELSSLGHGLFTYAILEALGGKADTKPADGLVSVKEMIDFAEHTVSDLSGQYAQTSQHPTAVSRGFDFAVGRY